LIRRIKKFKDLTDHPIGLIQFLINKKKA